MPFGPPGGVSPFAGVFAVEREISRSQVVGPNGSAKLVFAMFGTEDEETIRAVAEWGIPPDYLGLAFQDYELTPLGNGFWDVVANYGVRQPLKKNDPSSFAFSFDTTGGREKITQSLFTVASYGRANEVPPNFLGAIGVSNDRVEGCEITVPSLQFSITVRKAKADVTLDYIAFLYQATGKLNNAPWKGFPAAELLFLGATGQQRGEEDPEITYKFLGSQNKQTIQIGEIVVAEKYGHDYLWVLYEDDVSDFTLVKRPKAAYVEAVYEELDFSTLGLGV